MNGPADFFRGPVFFLGTLWAVLQRAVVTREKSRAQARPAPVRLSDDDAGEDVQKDAGEEMAEHMVAFLQTNPIRRHTWRHRMTRIYSLPLSMGLVVPELAGETE
jgi:hypothetical protein